MKLQLLNKRLPIYLIILWWVLALFGFVSSLLFMIHQGKEITFTSSLEMSFYHWIPALLWTFITPLLTKFYFKFSIMGAKWVKSFIMHVVISLVFVFALRILALSIDFTIKFYIGLMEEPILNVLKSVVWVIPASSFKEILYYWIVIATTHFIGIKYEYKDTLTVVCKQGLVPLAVDEIYWMASNRNYVDIHGEHEKFKVRNSIGSLECELNPNIFYRVHRSYIVNKHMIKTLSHWRRGEYLIIMKNQKVLTSSRSFNKNIKRLLEG